MINLLFCQESKGRHQQVKKTERENLHLYWVYLMRSPHHHYHAAQHDPQRPNLHVLI